MLTNETHVLTGCSLTFLDIRVCFSHYTIDHIKYCRRIWKRKRMMYFDPSGVLNVVELTWRFCINSYTTIFNTSYTFKIHCQCFANLWSWNFTLSSKRVSFKGFYSVWKFIKYVSWQWHQGSKPFRYNLSVNVVFRSVYIQDSFISSHTQLYRI